MDILPGEWLKVFTGVNIAVMVGIGAIAFVLEYSKKVGDGWCILIPPLLGASWGVLAGLDAKMTDGASVATHVAQGVLINAGAAAVFGRGVSFLLDQYWKRTQAPVAPPAPEAK